MAFSIWPVGIRKGTFHHASPSRQWLSIGRIGRIGIGIGIDPRPVWHLALMDRSNFAAELCQHRNNTVEVPGFPCPNSITRLFDTETDNDPDADLASPLNFSDSLRLGSDRSATIAGRPCLKERVLSDGLSLGIRPIQSGRGGEKARLVLTIG